MRRRKNRKGSVLVAVMCIFVLISAFAIIIFQYSMNNLQQAKIQEENMRAYYLAYSGCELTYVALTQRAMTEVGTSPVFDTRDKRWAEFVKNRLSSISGTSTTNPFSICFSKNGVGEAGYTETVTLPEIGDSEKILVRASIVETSPPEFEREVEGWIRIEAIGRTNIGGKYAGEKTKYLYINPQEAGRIFWK